jgi:hypothetical protein
MGIVDDAINNFEDSILTTVYSEFNRILHNIPIFSNIHKLGYVANIVLVSCNQLFCMGIVEDGSINYEASTLITLCSE